MMPKNLAFFFYSNYILTWNSIETYSKNILYFWSNECCLGKQKRPYNKLCFDDVFFLTRHKCQLQTHNALINASVSAVLLHNRSDSKNECRKFKYERTGGRPNVMSSRAAGVSVMLKTSGTKTRQWNLLWSDCLYLLL